MGSREKLRKGLAVFFCAAGAVTGVGTIVDVAPKMEAVGTRYPRMSECQAEDSTTCAPESLRQREAAKPEMIALTRREGKGLLLGAVLAYAGVRIGKGVEWRKKNVQPGNPTIKCG
jgi:hypothetical protein